MGRIGEERFRETISFSEASRFGGNTAFSLMLKPVGSACNLHCEYCYYLCKGWIPGQARDDNEEAWDDNEGIRDGNNAVRSNSGVRMPVSLLEAALKDFFGSCDLPELTVEWHGGEPLQAGMDFFKSALSLEKKYSGGRRVHNTLQTNGTLLNAEWAEFFHDNDFLIGLSIDGPENLHDRYRRDRGGHPTFRRVMAAVEELLRKGVEFNTLTTISKASEGRGAEVYRFLKSIGSRFMQFMPVYEHIRFNEAGRPLMVPPGSDTSDASVSDWSVEPLAFGQYLCDIFDIWVREDVGEYFVPTFDAALACWCGIPPGICVFCESCGGNFVVERDGSIYPCDHFVYPQYRLGRIGAVSLRQIATSAEMLRFGVGKRNNLPDKCLSCHYRFACNGGCPKHRFAEGGLSSLCEGYRLFYSHIAPYMERMKLNLFKDV